MRIFTVLLLLAILMPAVTPRVMAAAPAVITQDDSAVRFMVYFTVGRDDTPATNITRAQFESHLKELRAGDYHVVSLPDVMAAYKTGSPLPVGAVVLTFDGGDRSILDNAVPLLEEYKMPYTLFIAPDRADRAQGPFLHWNNLRHLHRSGLATIGLHPESYSRIGTLGTENIRQNINNATARFRDEMGFQPLFFSYPFGEYTKSYKDIIATYGFKAAMGQHSAVAYNETDHLALPRFTMTEEYGDTDRFVMTSNALPLPVTDVTPNISHIDVARPAIGFTVDDSLSESLTQLSCFASGQEKPEMNILGNRIELRLQQPINQTRLRINCTLPVKDDKSVEPYWRWFGMLLTMDEPPVPVASDTETAE